MTSLYERIVEVERRLDELEDLAAARYGFDRASGAAPETRTAVPPDVLTIGLVGGTGVGKSTIVNALAGRDISAASARRPTTDRIIPYVHRDRAALLGRLDFLAGQLSESVAEHDVDGLRSLLLFDLPDMDSLQASHAAVVRRALAGLDVVVWVTSLTKYGDRLFQQWIREHAAGMDLDNFVFVLNKTDEIDESDRAAAAERLERRFRDLVGETLAGVPDALGRPEIYLMSARHPRARAPGNEFERFEASLIRERDQRELDRIKSSNRLAHVARRLARLDDALDVDGRRETLTSELEEIRDLLERRAADDGVQREIAELVRTSNAQDHAARLVFNAELETWPLLPRLRLLAAPLRQLGRLVRQLQVLASADAEERERRRVPLPSLRDAILAVQTERRRRRSRIAEPGIPHEVPVRTEGEVEEWLVGLENECVARVRQASVDDTTARPAPSRGGRVLRRVLVWGPLLWFPLVQPLLQEILDPDSAVASLSLRLVHRLVRITGAPHLLVSLIFIAVVYTVYLLVLRGVAHRAATRRCRRLLDSDWWRETLRGRLTGLVLGDVQTALDDLDEESKALAAIRTDLEDVRRAVDERRAAGSAAARS